MASELPALLTSADAAFQLDLPGSTLRLYVQKLSRQLSRSARRSKQRLFTTADIAKLRELRRRLQNGESMAAAVAAVAAVVETVPEDEAANMEAELVLLSPRRLAAQLAVLIRESRDTAEQQSAALAEANRELAVIKAWLLLPAWKRLLTTPNLDKPPAS